jgi:hypothetical protein
MPFGPNFNTVKAGWVQEMDSESHLNECNRKVNLKQQLEVEL